MPAQPVTLIDGGLSSALAARGVDLDHPLWTARLLLGDPDTLVAAHRDFLAGGATVVITSSYQASRQGFAAQGLDAAAADDALRTTTAAARAAIAAHTAARPHDPPARVAASVGPYGAVLADGSEYTGRYPVGHDALVAFHAERLAVLIDTAPDLLAVETMPGAAEARAVAAALTLAPGGGVGPGRGPVPAWVSFTCPSATHTAAGDRIEDAVRAALAVPGVVAVGVNCTAPTHVGELLRRAATVTDLPLVAYPNRGQAWDADAKAWVGDPVAGFGELDGQLDGWLAAGARWVGGCCGVGPADIAALRDRLSRPTRPGPGR